MRREPAPQSAADIARAQSQEPNPEPQPESEQPIQRKRHRKLMWKSLNQKIMINRQIMTMRIIIDKKII